MSMKMRRLIAWLYLFVGYFLAVVKAQTQRGETNLECRKDSIRILLSREYVSKLKLDVTNPNQLHMKDYPDCYSSLEDSGYGITLYPPYENCGTAVKPSADRYEYSNEIVFENEGRTILIFKFKCDYDKKYVVSSDVALNPVVRTLNFVTARGEFSVGMGLYHRSDYHPKSMFSARPTVLVGTTVYVAIDIDDAFDKKEIVTSIETCYATDNKDYDVQNLYHSLIVNKCSSPEDDTVQIISNGQEMSAKFRFQMFAWKRNIEYFYLHCEVKVCNKTEEQCSGVGPVCAGVIEDNNVRRRRESEEESRATVKGNRGLVSYGPVAVTKEDSNSEVGQGTFEVVYEELEKDQKFLRAYIYITIATVVLLAGAVAIIVVVVKKKREARRKMLKETELGIQST